MTLERRDGEPGIRVSDADRDRTVAQLRTHLTDGRLTIDEFSDRVADALAARTGSDLSITLRDLPPAPAPVVAEDPVERSTRMKKLRRDAAGFVTTNATCIGIWMLTTGGRHAYFWPGWVLFGTGIGFIGRLISGESKEDKKERERAEKERVKDGARPDEPLRPRPAGAERVVVSVLFVDMVGSTEQATVLGDTRWRELLDKFGTLVRAELQRYGGHEVFMKGDEVVAAFDAPAQAVRCACAIRDDATTIGVQVRAGIHAGEVDRREDEVSGIALHIGHRVSTRAEPGEVLVSSTVKELTAGSAIAYTDRGEHELKGVSGAWRLYAVSE